MSDAPLTDLPEDVPTPVWRISTWSFADAQGYFIGRVYAGSEEFLALNTPADHIAVEGRHDPLCRRWDAVAEAVVAYQPDAPADDDLQTWAWDEEAERWVSQPTLAAIKVARWAAIKAARDAAEFGGFAWDGSSFDSDGQSQSRIMGATQLATLAAAAEQPFAIDWTLQDNTVRTLSGAEMIAVGMALGTHVATQHGIGRAVRAAIEEATTAEELEAIEWP
jgi:hypothetical protein